MSTNAPTINFAQIHFPSDKVTIKTLRRAFPHCFDITKASAMAWHNREHYDRVSTEAALGTIIGCERMLAAQAFKNTLAQPLSKDDLLLSRDELIEELEGIYARLSLGNRQKSVKDLISSIELQAVAQAQAFSRSRP